LKPNFFDYVVYYFLMWFVFGIVQIFTSLVFLLTFTLVNLPYVMILNFKIMQIESFQKVMATKLMKPKNNHIMKGD